MAKFTVLVLVAAFAVTLERTNAKDETNKMIAIGMTSVMEACSKEIGISEAIDVSHKNKDLDSTNPCLLKCMFQKMGTVTDKNTFNKDHSSGFTKKILTREGDAEKIDEILDACVPDSEHKKVYKTCEDWKTLLYCILDEKERVDL